MWDRTFLNNTYRDWVFFFSIIILSIIVLKIFQKLVVKRIKVFTSRTKSTLDDFIITQVQNSIMPFLYLSTIYVAFHYLHTTIKAQHIARTALLIIIVFFILKIINAVISYAFKRVLEKGETSTHPGASRGIVIILRLLTGFAGLLFVIDNLGYDITTLIAGLGIGGIAIALASQTVLADLFNYLAIFFDKPFETGDFIVLDDKMGTVEYIGIRTTRLRTLGGEQLVCSNTDLTSARVHNYKRMQERRTEFSFGIVYSTEIEKLKLIPGWVKIIIESIPKTKFDRAHFKTLADSSLQFEVVYYILNPDYNEFMNIQQQINFLLLELFEKEKIQFAFPTQTVVLESDRERQLAETRF